MVQTRVPEGFYSKAVVESSYILSDRVDILVGSSGPLSFGRGNQATVGREVETLWQDRFQKMQCSKCPDLRVLCPVLALWA